MSRAFGPCGQITVDGGGDLKLAPDLAYPNEKALTSPFRSVSLDPSGSLTTALSLTGRFAVDFLRFSGLGNNDAEMIRLTIDGEVIWNADPTSNASTEIYLGFANTITTDITLVCEESFLLEVQTGSASSVTLEYIARPVL